MTKKRTYQSVDVERFDLATIVHLLTLHCLVTIDVAKTKFVAAFATAAGQVLKLVRFEHPRQTAAFLAMVETLRDAKREPRVIMEPTGTYGDAVRFQIQRRGVPVFMMPPKHTHDYAEVIDGVPSMHDPKAATVLAELAAVKLAKGTLKQWEPPSESRRDVRALLDQRWPLSHSLDIFHGHLEALLARHWPELESLLDLHAQRSWMSFLQRYPGPQAVAAAPEEAAKTLWLASRKQLGKELTQEVVQSAKKTLGMPMTPLEQAKLRATVAQIEHLVRHLDAVDAQIAEAVEKDPEMRQLAVVVGPVCAAALQAHVGSPAAFASAGALEKAGGLNLKVRSSGKKEGHVGITKRGPGQVRQLLYLAALRLIKDDRITAAWYRARGSYRGPKDSKKSAVVAVMRKLLRALWHVARGATFDTTKLFDVRRLNLTTDADVPPARRPFTRNTTLPAQPNQGGIAQSSHSGT